MHADTKRAEVASDALKSSLASGVSQTQVTEETRLAVAVHHIDEEVSVVPRGAFVKDPHSIVKVNRSFGGESTHAEATLQVCSEEIIFLSLFLYQV